MDPEIASLASTAGTTLVTLLTTESWQGIRDRLVSLWQRARPDRASAIADELDAAREELLGAQATGDPEAEVEVGAEWQGRIRRLLTAHPELATELDRVMSGCSPDSR
ncbi:hypothetical protein [Streptomyces sp. ok210]|uniref:hypothetical protein n=1 Tax=Streptomyces sp. ok210 TaxID=1761905 RepID=UPI0008DF71F5|nr:hypothetical protein [Streptomyces sp. ok210]SFT12617.1 hypothetical protein SAMN04487982_107264 [Streptomyces sp. ok210]